MCTPFRPRTPTTVSLFRADFLQRYIADSAFDAPPSDSKLYSSVYRNLVMITSDSGLAGLNNPF